MSRPVTAAAFCVAVVDDEASVRAMLERVLRHGDYEVCAFASGEEFLASLARRVPCCVVLDVHMPGLNGFEVESRLRAAHCDVPVVFITASDDPSLDRPAREADRALLRKPFSSLQLLAAIDAALQAPKRAPA